MEINILLLFFLFNLSLCYYSLKLNKVYLQSISNDINNMTIGFNENENNEINDEYFDYLKNSVDFPLNYSDLESVNQSFILTKNINSELYTVRLYLGSNMQYFRLLLSTFDDLVTVSSTNCALCNVSNKYNSLLSSTAMKLKSSNGNSNTSYELFKDLCLIPAKSIQNYIMIKRYIKIPSLNFKVIEKDSSGFLNSGEIDGILGLNYNNDTGSKNFIRELYNEGYISSLSFSIIITSSNVNRLYLGDIMENDYIKNNYESSVNKGECSIIDNNWKCKLKNVEYNALKYIQHQKQVHYSDSIVSFNIKENKLIIPNKYYNLIVRSYKMVKRKKSSIRTRQYNKLCSTFDNVIYCGCSDKDDFGIVTFHFGNDSKLDIDLRDYVSYDSSAFYFRCRTDFILSKNNEFVVGLKGLNNTILSFNMEEKKIKFFHLKKAKDFFWTALIILILLIIAYSIFQ